MAGASPVKAAPLICLLCVCVHTPHQAASFVFVSSWAIKYPLWVSLLDAHSVQSKYIRVGQVDCDDDDDDSDGDDDDCDGDGDDDDAKDGESDEKMNAG